MRIAPVIFVLLLTCLLPVAADKPKVPVREQDEGKIPKPDPELATEPETKPVPKPPVKPAPKPTPTPTPTPAPAPASKPETGPRSAPWRPAAAPSPKVDWKPEYHKGRAYLPAEQVAAYYELDPPKESGRTVIIAKGDFRIEMQRGEKEMRLKGWTFYFSFPVVELKGKPYLSLWDVRNVLDPILFPQARRDPAALRTVVIDPAAGGKESGIRTPLIAEKDLTLDVARRMADRLAAHGFKVVLTRAGDQTVSPDQRRQVAALVAEEAIYVSLRASSSSRPATRGMETSTLPPAGTPATWEPDKPDIDKRFFAGNINDRESLALATTLQSSAVTTLKSPDLGIKRLRFDELRDINMPAAVCRLGYLSNRDEARKLADPQHRARLADSLCDGIRRYATYLRSGMEERQAEERSRPLQFGDITASRAEAGASLTGEKVVLTVPVKAAAGVGVDRARVEVQLFLFETVNGAEIDLSTADAPQTEWLSVLPDWRDVSTEVLEATWLRPQFSNTETKVYGKRAYYGWIARLVYDGRVMDEASSPPNLNRALFYFTNVFPRR